MPTLRLQLIVLHRKLHGRVRLTNRDRWFFVQLYRWFPRNIDEMPTSDMTIMNLGIAEDHACELLGIIRKP